MLKHLVIAAACLTASLATSAHAKSGFKSREISVVASCSVDAAVTWTEEGWLSKTFPIFRPLNQMISSHKEYYAEGVMDCVNARDQVVVSRYVRLRLGKQGLSLGPAMTEALSIRNLKMGIIQGRGLDASLTVGPEWSATAGPLNLAGGVGVTLMDNGTAAGELTIYTGERFGLNGSVFLLSSLLIEDLGPAY
jgi:hypothetical protein